LHYYSTSIVLPVEEYARLQRLMLTMIGGRSALASILRRKLGAATPVSSALRPDVAVSGREVHFKVDGEQLRSGVLTWAAPKRGDTAALSLLTPRGLALLGLCPGETTAYVTRSGRTEHLELDHVAEGKAPRRTQPAAGRKPAYRGASAGAYPAIGAAPPMELVADA
jgi:hypothetical protein